MERRRAIHETTDASPPTDQEAEALLKLFEAEVKRGPPDPLSNEEMVRLEKRGWAKRETVKSKHGALTHTFEDQWLTHPGRLMCATAETLRLAKRRRPK